MQYHCAECLNKALSQDVQIKIMFCNNSTVFLDYFVIISVSVSFLYSLIHTLYIMGVEKSNWLVTTEISHFLKKRIFEGF